MRFVVKWALCLSGLSLSLLVAQNAQASSSYEPYYYDRDKLPAYASVPYAQEQDDAQPVVVIQAPVPADEYRTAHANNIAAMSTNPSPAMDRPIATYNVPSAKNGINLGTDQGIEFGVQASNYHYQEHPDADTQSMRQNSVKYGAILDGTAAFNYGSFLTADLRFAYSRNDYQSAATGKLSSVAPDYLGEGRVLFGDDFIYGDGPASLVSFDLSPYFGMGYRNQYNNLSGISGESRRDSEYFYIPMGVTQRFRMPDNARISTNAEFDYLLWGTQTDYVSSQNVVNNLHHGLGVRGGVMYERQSWGIGPFVNYWNVDASNTSAGITVPHSQNLEYGGQVRYRF